MGLKMSKPKDAAENQERVAALPDLSHKVYSAIHRAKKAVGSPAISEEVGLKSVQTNGAISILGDRHLIVESPEKKGTYTSFASGAGWDVNLRERNRFTKAKKEGGKSKRKFRVKGKGKRGVAA